MTVSRLGKIVTRFAGAFFLAGAWTCLPVLGAGPKGTVYQFTVPKQLNMLQNPIYYCWLPDSVGTVRCIIVHQHGCTREGDAPAMMGDVQWLSFAKKWHAAFIAPHLYTDVPGSNAHCNNWDDINNGSGNTFLAALDSLAARCAHPEIKTVPWALWGHSGGSMWILAMIGKFPQRVAVGVAQACGVDVSNVPAALAVPVLHHNGVEDLCYNDVYFGNARAKGALWAHAIDPHVTWVSEPNAQPPSMMGHAPHDLRMIAIPWMDIVLSSRLPNIPGDSILKPMDTSNAWLGDTTTRAISSEANYVGDKLKACWFPNQRFAELWKEYMTNGTISDSTPIPPAPYNLAGVYSNRQIKLTWDADADIESGIKTFTIYRNGIILDTMQWPNAPTTLFTLEKGFQRWEDGDQPDPSPAPAMTFTDNTVTDTGTYTYQVCTVNWCHVGGVKSGTLKLSHGSVTSVSAHSSVPAPRSVWSTMLTTGVGRGEVLLPAGSFDIYDIRGRLQGRVTMTSTGILDIKHFLDDKTGSVFIVKSRSAF